MSDAEHLESLRKEFGRLQRAYAAAETRLGLVRDLFSILGATDDEDAILQQALEAVQEAVGVEAGSVLMVDADDGKLHFAAATGPKAEEVKAFSIDPGIGVAGWCFQQNEPVAVSDVASDARFYRQISKAIGFETRSLCCAPIRLSGQAVGVLELINRQKGDEFHTEEMQTISMVGIMAGQLVGNARRLRGAVG